MESNTFLKLGANLRLLMTPGNTDYLISNLNLEEHSPTHVLFWISKGLVYLCHLPALWSHFWAWDRACTEVRVPTICWIIFQSLPIMRDVRFLRDSSNLPWLFRAIKNRRCSSSVHLPVLAPDCFALPSISKRCEIVHQCIGIRIWYHSSKLLTLYVMNIPWLIFFLFPVIWIILWLPHHWHHGCLRPVHP